MLLLWLISAEHVFKKASDKERQGVAADNRNFKRIRFLRFCHIHDHSRVTYSIITSCPRKLHGMLSLNCTLLRSMSQRDIVMLFRVPDQ